MINETPGAGSAPGFFLLSRRKEHFVRLLTGRLPNLPAIDDRLRKKMFGNSIALAALALMLTGGDHRARADGDCLSLIQDLRSQSAQVMAVERRQKIDGLLTSAENELKAGNSVSCQADAKDAQTLLAR